MQSTRRQPVTDVALQGGTISVATQVDRAKVLRRLQLGDAAFRHLTRAAAVAVLVGTVVTMAYPLIRPETHVKVPGLRPLPPLELAGRNIYIREITSDGDTLNLETFLNVSADPLSPRQWRRSTSCTSAVT